MGFWKCLFAVAWLLQSCFGNYAPRLASSSISTINPTQTTIALERPFCLSPGAFNVYLFAIESSGSTTNFLNGTKLTGSKYAIDTNVGKTGQYQVSSFNYPGCNPPSLTNPDSAAIKDYIFRVGDDVTCLTDPNQKIDCNPPLVINTKYSFKYVFTDGSGNIVDQTAWSSPIITKQGKQPSTLDTWPGRRSGAMIVITSILSTLLFFLLVGFIAAVVSSFLFGSPASGGVETTKRHETQTSVLQKTQEPTDPTYSSALPASERERYATHPQV